MSSNTPINSDQVAARVPNSFLEYLRSFGPGLVVVLTWLGAGDIVDMGVAGGNYGYSLMWVLVLAVVMRFLFVSLIAKYQLCNQHGESVLDGLARLHPWYAPVLLVAAVVMGHVLGSYMTRGVGEACRNVTGIGEIWQWALLCNGIGLALVFRPAYQRVEVVFKILLAVLSVSFLGTAIWVGLNPQGIVHGLYSMQMPEQAGRFGPLLVATAMIGAIGGSLMNLVYPYFLEAKGWRGPKYRRVQFYDFLLAVSVMIVLDLAIWTLGAELLHPHQLSISEMDDMPWLLSMVLGPGGRTLFYVGIFAVVFTSLIGQSLGLACLGSHAYFRWKAKSKQLSVDYRQSQLYRWIVVWCLVSPLVWTAPGMPGFVTLTLVMNGAQVLLLPVIAGGLWWITAFSRYIGDQHRNRWWENLVMAILFALAAWAAFGSINAIVSMASGAGRQGQVEIKKKAVAELQQLEADVQWGGQGEVISVDLSKTNVTDHDLKNLTLLSKLKALDLSNTSVTDIGLFHLKSRYELETLDLRRTNVTRAGVGTLQQSLPKCRIQYSSSP